MLPAHAQDLDSVALFQETLQSDFFGVDGRAMAMGNTGIVTSRDGSAAIYNPAMLARIRRIEFRGSLSHLSSANNSRRDNGTEALTDGRDLRTTNINALSLTLPIPTYRGSLVVAFGLHRVNSFDRAAGLQYPTYIYMPYISDRARETETGGMWKWNVAGALDISPRLSTGLSLHLLTGHDKYRWNRVQASDRGGAQSITENQKIDINYVGTSATAGLTYALSQTLTAGLTIETPTYLQAEETHSTVIDTAYSRYEWVTDEGFSNYTITRPFVFGFGLAGDFNRLLLTGDLRYTDWSQLNIRYQESSLSDASDLQFIQDNLKEVIGWNVGAEYLFPAQGMELRAGYFVDPLPIDSRFIESQRQYMTFGAGILIDRVMTVDLAYVHGGYELRNGDPGLSFAKYKTRRVFVTFGYRI